MVEELSFPLGMAEHLRYYVYALRDPRPGCGIFYVGKGKGNRVYQHALASLAHQEDEELGLKLETIREIRRDGCEVGVEIVRYGLDESSAYEVEAGIIDTLRLAGIPLTNCARGIDSVARGWHPLNELRALYAAPRLPEVHERLILIKINRLYRPDMTDNELYEATRKWWKCAPHRHEPQLALAVYLGVVRAVYRVRGWEKSPNEDGKGPPRYAFHGTHAGDVAAAYEWHNVANLVGQTQNPIKYVNC